MSRWENGTVGNQTGGIMARWENVQVGKRQSGITGGGKMAWWENDIGKMGRIRFFLWEVIFGSTLLGCTLVIKMHKFRVSI